MTFTLHHILPATEDFLSEQTFLLLINVYQKPPHLALSVNGRYYSLSVRGAESDKEMAAILRAIHLRKTPSVFVQLNSPDILTFDYLNALIDQIVQSYPALDAGIATCLSPIKEYCHAVYGTEINDVDFVFELLPRLQAQGKVGKCYGLYLSHFINAQSIELVKYTMDDINKAIRVGRKNVALV